MALVAGTNQAAVDKALRAIRVEYEVQEPLLDFTKALDNDIVVHPEDDWKPLVDVGGDNKRNLVAKACDRHGDIDAVLASSDVVIDRTYHTRQNQQAAMETFRAYAYKDAFGRLTIVSSTQVPFHVRRVVSHALEIPKSKVRVIKPRIGGGFGSKQTVVMEVYPAFIAWLTGKPAYMVYSREESLTVSTPRHESQIRVVLGASRTVISGASSSILYGTPVRMVNIRRRRLPYRDTSRFLCITPLKPFNSAIPVSILIRLLPGLIEAMGRHKASLPWRQPSTNWPKRSI